MIEGRSGRIVMVAVVLALLMSAAIGAAAERAASGVPAAKVGEETIFLEEVEAPIQAQLAQLEQRRYTLLTQRLDQLIGERLIAREAKQLGVTVEQLLKTEVYAKTPEIPDSEVAAFMNQNRDRLPPGNETELRLKVWDYLRSQKLNEGQQAYVRRLRSQGSVSVYIEEPTGTRVRVSQDKGFALGPKDAPVTITEFSDFQCPYCRTVVATVKRLMNEYAGKLRWVFRDFPIAGLHPGAPKAHEAARCAAEGGKFWEYHDLLFDRSPRHSNDELKRYAQELGLDAVKFAECLDSGRHQAAVTSDMQEGMRLGVTGTPTFFINGRALVGAQPLSAFETVVELELAKKPAP